ncbi:sensor histidine kinase [Elongatibacter sediminis]|uniref:histidine kinase n=1 Tax=Elongatibacter sediminis TaxID=3119006 RepID=A0AAW9RHN3_9GAMM
MRRKSRFSLEGRFIALLSVIVAGSAVLSALLALHWRDGWLVIPVVMLVAIVAVVAAVRRFFRPIDEIHQALRSGVASFKDHDYSVTIATSRGDELGELVQVYNELAESLRNERFDLFQRELMLDTVIQSSAVAVYIANEAGAVIYGNREAADLVGKRGGIEGHDLLKLTGARAESLAAAIADGKDGLFTLPQDGDGSEILHLTCRNFNLNGRIHRLFLIKKLTREITRREVETWKKVIRVITHEMNNSLAPIRSLITSAQKIAETGKGGEHLRDIYQSIGSRAGHLQTFIEEYAHFARLPHPRAEWVDWNPFVTSLESLAEFKLAENLPDDPGHFDPVQMEQVLLNLMKNAAESGSDSADIRLRVLQNETETLIAVEDRGDGMSTEQMQLALLPFYSTKRSGTGLGLPLCREIVEAHGGTFNLFARQDGGMAATCRLPRPPG